MRRWGPWTQGRLNKVRYDIRRYFRAYYAELRRLVAEHDAAADIPGWFRGGRRITSFFCTDGVVVNHMPFDEEAMTSPEQDDRYEFGLAREGGILFPVWWVVSQRYSPELPDGRKITVMPGYAPGEDFGVFVRLWPAHEGHPAPAGKQLSIVSKWTRLDAVSMSSLDVWRDPTAARRQAWEALRPYVEGGEVPVPRPVH